MSYLKDESPESCCQPADVYVTITPSLLMIGLLLISELFIHVDVYSIIRRHIISTQCLATE